MSKQTENCIIYMQMLTLEGKQTAEDYFLNTIKSFKIELFLTFIELVQSEDIL